MVAKTIAIHCARQCRRDSPSYSEAQKGLITSWKCRRNKKHKPRDEMRMARGGQGADGLSNCR